MTSMLELRYASYAELDSCLSEDAALLGVIAFGTRAPGIDVTARTRAPFAWIDMPTLRGAGFCEIWTNREPVEYVQSRGMRAARSEHFMFACLQSPENDGVEAAARDAYRGVFDAMDAFGFPYLWRAWNYLPAINAEVGGVERYRQFNMGRHDAFAARGFSSGAAMPAACALGCRQTPLTVYFIAGKAPGLAVENPRQMSAYHYPQQYGLRSPSFSRAMRIESAGQRVLAISGTASIVGHETRHVGDPNAQIEETIANIWALMSAAGYTIAAAATAGTGLLLKAYLRHPEYLPTIESALYRTFGAARVEYLQADI
ncbi:MAG TPA: hypothetical protein VFI62_08295, partial [Burkholderiales bacterium]|nr:hypothetical protein [Burkholderiales bacterium]